MDTFIQNFWLFILTRVLFRDKKNKQDHSLKGNLVSLDSIPTCVFTRSPPLFFFLQETASSCDEELLSLLLDAGLLVGCVSSALYPLLSSHMLSHQQEGGWDVEKAAAELMAAGHGPEAGSLLLAHRGTHSAQFTFNSALAVLEKWLWKETGRQFGPQPQSAVVT